MRFDSLKPYKQLIEHGVVATMRNYDYYPGQKIVIKSRYHRSNIHAVVQEVVKNNQENREKYLSISGFDSVDEWIQEAKKLHKKWPRLIVIVKLVRTVEKIIRIDLETKERTPEEFINEIKQTVAETNNKEIDHKDKKMIITKATLWIKIVREPNHNKK
ncbi:MAG: hypothetical protein Q6363_008100 [Candidatus Njordarchaeota archaeon]